MYRWKKAALTLLTCVPAVMLMNAGPQAAAVKDSLDVVSATNSGATASQQKIDGLARETRNLLEEYRSLLDGSQYQAAYTRELEELEQAQQQQLATLREQITQARITRQRIAPLMRSMADSLEKFVVLDLPFHQEQRVAAVLELKQRLRRPDLPVAAKFRMLLEAFQLEQDYGGNIESWRGPLQLGAQELSVEYLRIGRVALYYQSLDGSASGYWGVEEQAWIALDERFNRGIGQALRVAQNVAAPQLLSLPLPVTGGEHVSRRVLPLAGLVLALLQGALCHGQDTGAASQITNLDQLLDSVRQAQQQQQSLNTRREREFLQDNARQKEILAQARRDLEQRKRQNQPLLAVTENNGTEIAALEKELASLVQEMGDLASTYREFAGDFAAVMQQSMITAQFPQRSEQMQALAASAAQPSIAQIETLWLSLQQEMTEAGKIARFQAPVVLADGSAEQREVLRIGTFSAFADGDFLRYVPETGELLLLSRQPAARFRNEAREFALQSEGVARVTVDPSRGNLLGMLAYTPSLRERIEQGGSIGLIILFLGAFGLLLSFWRILYLGFTYLRIQAQLRDISRPSLANPLGRVLAAVEGIPLQEEELLQLKLDEAVLAEIPALERGNGLIKLLAATSPLLGLLGTVTGMILTFQAISLFGSGDPKLMAGGISQALVTTVLGLVVAIPLLFGHSLINALSRSMVQRLDEQCAGVLARSAEQQAGN